MPFPRLWPRTSAERSDRDVVIDLVTRVGRHRLRWTVYDVRAACREGKITLNHSDQLARHLNDLPETFVRCVGRRFDNGTSETKCVKRKTPAPGMQTVGRSARTYVLAERLTEFAANRQEFDDLEKIRIALWVAVTALGVSEVPTAMVALALAEIPALHRVCERLVGTELLQLSRREPALAERRVKEGVRWLQWAPTGEPPTHPDFSAWVDAFRSLDAVSIGPTAIGHVTRTDMVQELVELAIGASVCPAWPMGRSVTVADIEEAARGGRARVVRDALKALNANLAEVLGDASKQRIVGRTRVTQRVIKITAPSTGRSYYDIATDPAFRERGLIVPYRALTAEMAREAMDRLLGERDALRALEHKPHTAIMSACVQVRWLLLVREVERLSSLAEALHCESLSPQLLEVIGKHRAWLDDLRRALGPQEERTLALTRILRPLGMTVRGVMNAARPVLSAEQYASWIPARYMGGRSATELLAGAMLRRIPNVLHLQRNHSDARFAAAYVVDRVEALSAAAEKSQSRITGFLITGASALGPWLRHIPLVRALCDSSDQSERRAAIAALSLLDCDAAEETALAWLDKIDALRPGEAGDALYALLVAKRVDPARWSEAVRRPSLRYGGRDSDVKRAAIDVVLAARQGRWLMQA